MASSIASRCAASPSGRRATTTVAGRPATVRVPAGGERPALIGRGQVARRRLDDQTGPPERSRQVGCDAVVDDVLPSAAPISIAPPTRSRCTRAAASLRRRPRDADDAVEVVVSGGVARSARRGARPACASALGPRAGRRRDRPRHRERRERAQRDRRRSAQHARLVTVIGGTRPRTDGHEHADRVAVVGAWRRAARRPRSRSATPRCGAAPRRPRRPRRPPPPTPRPTLQRRRRRRDARRGDRHDDVVVGAPSSSAAATPSRATASQNPAGASRSGSPRSASRAGATSASSARHSADASRRASTAARSASVSSPSRYAESMSSSSGRGVDRAHPVTPSATARRAACGARGGCATGRCRSARRWSPRSARRRGR